MSSKTLPFRRDAAATLRRGVYAGTTAIAVGLAGLTPAFSQAGKITERPRATQGVDRGNCGAFISYMLTEAEDFGSDMSQGFLNRVVRFGRAGCKSFDKNGEIQLITETNQDSISYGTALSRMGRYDIISVSGVRHCHRPDGSSCPVTTGSASTPHPAGGG